MHSDIWLSYSPLHRIGKMVIVFEERSRLKWVKSCHKVVKFRMEFQFSELFSVFINHELTQKTRITKEKRSLLKKIADGDTKNWNYYSCGFAESKGCPCGEFRSTGYKGSWEFWRRANSPPTFGRLYYTVSV